MSLYTFWEPIYIQLSLFFLEDSCFELAQNTSLTYFLVIRHLSVSICA